MPLLNWLFLLTAISYIFIAEYGGTKLFGRWRWMQFCVLSRKGSTYVTTLPSKNFEDTDN